MVLDRLRVFLQRRKIDAILITQPENRRYISGYTGHDVSIAESSGVLLVPATGRPFLFTDSRYLLQAEAEAAEFQVELYSKGLLALLKKKLPLLSVKRLGFESHYLLHATAAKLSSLADKLGIELMPLSDVIEGFRVKKSAEEIEKIRQAVQLNEEVFQKVFKELRPGQTERQVALKIETLMRKKGADGPSFDTIVAAGPNGALPHAVPTNRPIQEGEPVIIDMGLKINGYCSDMTRTVVCGAPDTKTKKLFRIVRKAQLAGMKAIKAGVTARDADGTARKIISNAGFGDRFGHGLGHGVGLAVHEAPSVNFRSRKKLRAGMVVTVEPGIYIPGWGGIRLENMVVVTGNGFELLNRDTTFLDL